MERRLIVIDERGEHAVTVVDGGVLVDDVRIAARIGGDGEVRLGPDESTVAWVAVAGDKRWVSLAGNVYELEIQT